MGAYYNEHDAFAAAWLRELIRDGQIPDGEVDERDIQAVSADDVRGFVQCHFFAGIGGWPLALALAGWPEGKPVWTGSCPCQPFSAAGAQAGGDDPRHLWPAWFRLIRECRPAAVLGEQVEAAVAHGWLDLVCDDLEGEGYAVGAVGLPAASVGAPHLRQRLWFVADAQDDRSRGNPGAVSGQSSSILRRPHQIQSGPAAQRGGEIGQLGHASRERSPYSQYEVIPGARRSNERRTASQPSISPWSDLVWLPCRDGKSRPIPQSSVQLVADGVSKCLVPSRTPGDAFPLAFEKVPNRVGLLRGAGNAINPCVGAEVIRAYLDISGGPNG